MCEGDHVQVGREGGDRGGGLKRESAVVAGNWLTLCGGCGGGGSGHG